MHKHVLSIDVGIRNFSYAFFVEGVLVAFGVDDLLKGVEKKEHKNYVHITRKWIDERQNITNIPKLYVIVECQMAAKMKIISACLETFFYRRCKKIAPICVKNYFRSLCRNYKDNKRTAVELADRYLKENGTNELRGQFLKLKKKDDAADSILQGVYFIDKLTKN